MKINKFVENYLIRNKDVNLIKNIQSQTNNNNIYFLDNFSGMDYQSYKQVNDFLEIFKVNLKKRKKLLSH